MSKFFESGEEFVKVKPVICNSCIHYLGDANCKAFPEEKIPEEIISSNEHSLPLPQQQNSLVFKRKYITP